MHLFHKNSTEKVWCLNMWNMFDFFPHNFFFFPQRGVCCMGQFPLSYVDCVEHPLWYCLWDRLISNHMALSVTYSPLPTYQDLLLGKFLAGLFNWGYKLWKYFHIYYTNLCLACSLMYVSLYVALENPLLLKDITSTIAVFHHSHYCPSYPE